MISDKLTIAVDFDGTIVEHQYPEIGSPVPGAFEILLKLQNEGHRLILWTYRSGKELENAIKYCNSKRLQFYAVNNNFPEEKYDHSYSRKISADLFIDDRNIGGLPQWSEIYEMVQHIIELR